MVALSAAGRQPAATIACRRGLPARTTAGTAATCSSTVVARKGNNAYGSYSRMVTCRKATVLVATAPASKNPIGAATRRGSIARGGGGAHRGAHPRRQWRPWGRPVAGATPPVGVPPVSEGSDLALRRTAHRRQGGGSDSSRGG
ncbi:hypothetical protein C4D60_Mb05t13590 [Musa balbisiana]|uniref:Uncharacterized protein n=1 Tax=Musa balbisiana TaxID=52838 RepID=A0A4V4H852_MUSBA|nr:hypothetical protein C4D60_Mb05t13590 [Musa balbisiana]